MGVGIQVRLINDIAPLDAYLNWNLQGMWQTFQSYVQRLEQSRRQVQNKTTATKQTQRHCGRQLEEQHEDTRDDRTPKNVDRLARTLKRKLFFAPLDLWITLSAIEVITLFVGLQ